MDENVKTKTENEVINGTENKGVGATEENAQSKSAEEMLAELLAENKRLKKAVDKSSSEASDWKKKFVATQSESEKLSMEKAEREAAIREELEMLRKESKVNRYAKSFMAMGYNEEMAARAAEAQFSGDTDELFRIQKAHTIEMEKKIRADIMKTMPIPATGNDDSVQLTQEQFDKMNYTELSELYDKHPDVYRRFAKK